MEKAQRYGGRKEKREEKKGVWGVGGGGRVVVERKRQKINVKVACVPVLDFMRRKCVKFLNWASMIARQR